jgi:predicted transcriptional regulator YheO
MNLLHSVNKFTLCNAMVNKTGKKGRREVELFERYVQIARVLAEMFSPILEVVVHDLRKPESAVIAIFNGHITGRKVGDGTTDIGVRRMKTGDVPDELRNYLNRSPDGQKLKSTSIAIRDEAGQLIGSLCLNLAIDALRGALEVLHQLTETTNRIEESFRIFDLPEEPIENLIRSQLAKSGKLGRALSAEERRKIVRSLYERGVFKTRAAMTVVARQLGISRPTLYGDLKEVQYDLGIR